MRYRLIGIDLDDTLLNRQKQISDANRAAIAAVHDAGCLITPCTGRTWHKAMEIALHELPNLEDGVFLDGAMICDVAGGRIKRHTTMPNDLSIALLDQFDSQRYVLVYCRLCDEHGYDYLLRGDGLAQRLAETWLKGIPERVTVRSHAAPDEVADTLGLRVVTADQAELKQASEVLARLDGATEALFWHELWFAENGLHVLQFYNRQVDKWPALQWIARKHDIADDEIAYLGDQINDITPLREAACGIAVANAVPGAIAAADFITHDCDDDGVAHALDQLLTGAWG